MKFSIFSKKQPLQEGGSALSLGLRATREGLLARINRAITGKSGIDAELLDRLEETLIAADTGVDTTLQIIERIERRTAKDRHVAAADLQSILRDEMMEMLCENSAEDDAKKALNVPFVMLVVGVNGAGKTTTLGKLAAQFAAQGKKVYIAAADTFRAAAIEQLQSWADRCGATLIKQRTGADPAAVAFDAVSSGKAHNADIILIDTAGRLHNKVNLMNELTKIRNAAAKVIDGAPHEVLLVLDGSTGQNAYRQAEEFSKATSVTALAVTKLDGTAKGGVVVGISAQFKIPVKYIGVGEKAEDLLPFDRRSYVENLLNG